MQLKPPGAPYRCNGCREVGFGRSYHCGNSNCSYILHEECFEVASIASHPFFPRSCFKFYGKAPGYQVRYCDACGKDVLGFVYHCSLTGYYLHPCCLYLNHRISDEEARGRVTLELSQNVPSKCVKCKHKNVRSGVKGWSYVSSSDSGGTFCYHVSCIKDLILENMQRGYFYQEIINSFGMSDRLYSQFVLRTIEMFQRGASSRRSGKMRMFTKISRLVFHIIFSAVLGDPVSPIATLVEALASD
ncbi:hypothetical protein Fmac_017160 [Flemingia macrophylla]|uniref:DC1 domain-containing protein n=1 Tax=Flemingia macrophylla TaxID=520843 RepID=A0ABD1M1B7_9FABA